MAARSTLGFLHLTGLRLGTRDQNWRSSGAKELVLTDLEHLHAEVGPIDLVLLAGGLTRTGVAAEFDEVDRLLDPVFEHLVRLGSSPSLIAVPGANDLVPAPRFDPVVRDLRSWHDDAELRDHVLATPEGSYMVRIREAFAHYAAWDGRNRWRRLPRTAGLFPGDSATTLEIGDYRLGVIGLNSAYCALANKAMDLEPRQLHNVCDQDAAKWLGHRDLALLLTSHPPSALAPRARAEFDAEVDVPGRVAAPQVGDRDGDGPREMSQGGAPPRRVIPGIPLCPDDGLCGYNAGRLGWKNGEVELALFPRRRHRHRIDRADENDLDDRGALHFTWRAKQFRVRSRG